MDKKINKNKYNIERFIDAQNDVYQDVLKELRNGYKETHWMWFIFPQLKVLGKSPMSYYYGIENKEEAEEYFNNPLLKERYLECLDILLNLDTFNPERVFGYIDSLKLKSSLTLFYLVSNNETIHKVIDKFYNDELCEITVKELEK